MDELLQMAALYGSDASLCGILLSRDEASAEAINLHSQLFDAAGASEEEAAVSQAAAIVELWRAHQASTAFWEEARCLECGGTVQPEYHPDIDQICVCPEPNAMGGIALDLVSGVIVYPERIA